MLRVCGSGMIQLPSIHASKTKKNAQLSKKRDVFDSQNSASTWRHQKREISSMQPRKIYFGNGQKIFLT